MKRISITLLAVGLLISIPAAAKVYRWVDDNGEVHYGRTLPPEYANRPHDILSESGAVLERVTDPLAAQQEAQLPDQDEQKDGGELEPLFSDEEVRVHSDNLLMLRYRSEEDLLEAMNLEIAQLGYDARLINQTTASVIDTITAQVRNAADRQRAGLPKDENLEKEIASLRQRLRRTDMELARLKNRESEIRARFESDLKRYRYLAGGGRPGSEIPGEDLPEQN